MNRERNFTVLETTMKMRYLFSRVRIRNVMNNQSLIDDVCRGKLGFISYHLIRHDIITICVMIGFSHLQLSPHLHCKSQR